MIPVGGSDARGRARPCAGRARRSSSSVDAIGEASIGDRAGDGDGRHAGGPARGSREARCAPACVIGFAVAKIGRRTAAATCSRSRATSPRRSVVPTSTDGDVRRRRRALGGGYGVRRRARAQAAIELLARTEGSSPTRCTPGRGWPGSSRSSARDASRQTTQSCSCTQAARRRCSPTCLATRRCSGIAPYGDITDAGRERIGRYTERSAHDRTVIPS